MQSNNRLTQKKGGRDSLLRVGNRVLPKGRISTWLALVPAKLVQSRLNGLLDKVPDVRLDRRNLRQLGTAAFTAPIIGAFLYYGVLAVDRYVSEADFIVRGMSSRRATGLDMLFQTFGISRTIDDTNAVQQYMLSRDAVRALETRLPLRAFFSNPKGDIFSRYPYFWHFFSGKSFEGLYEYYLDHVTVVQDHSKGITKLRVVTFDAAESRQIATVLIRLGEEMVNRMNERAQEDAVRTARAEVDIARTRLVKAQLDLTAFRNKELLIDPSKNSVSVLETITQLSTELNQTLARIQENTKTAPENPAIGVWRARAAALQGQIDKERAKIGGQDGSLAPKVSDYEKLVLTRELAERALATATNSLEAARQEARRQQIYIEEIVSPNLADDSGEPRRLRSIAAVLVVTLSAAAILWIIAVGAKEHAH